MWTTLIVHWDGTHWTVIPSPNIGPATTVVTPQQRWEQASDNELVGIAAVSPDDIWAVGEYSLAVPAPGGQYYTPTFQALPLTEHWNGTQWSLGPPVPTKALEYKGYQEASLHGSGDQAGFDAVAAAPPSDVIATDSGPGTTRGSAWQFSGSAWNPIVGAVKTNFLPQAVTIPAPTTPGSWVRTPTTR